MYLAPDPVEPDGREQALLDVVMDRPWGDFAAIAQLFDVEFRDHPNTITVERSTVN